VLTSIPNWEGLHPILVHFPIALLLVAPLLIAATVIFEKHARVLSVVTLCLIAIGTTAAFLAEQSGEAAARNAQLPAQASSVLERHEELAELTVKIFAALLVVYGAITAASIVFGANLPRGVRLVLNLGFLMLYVGGGGMLAKTAHAGGKLVHQYGVRNIDAVLASPAPRMALIESHANRDHDDD
jgi:uncharacterized membrane protein